MSTTFVTMEPMTLDQAVHLLRAIGCTVEPSDDRKAIAIDPDGNYFHLIDDPASYRTLSFNLSSGQLGVYPTEVLDGTNRVMGDCYALNDATWMADALNMVSEHEDEYQEIIGAGVPVPDVQLG
jgi:hypothetical protein